MGLGRPVAEIELDPVDPLVDNSVMGPLADVFVLVRPCDVDCVVRCVESAREHLGDQCGRICILTAALQRDIRVRLEQLGCAFLNEADLFGAAVAETQADLFAQMAKWELRRFATTATYLVIHADYFFHSPTRLWQDDQPILFCQNRYRFGYAMCFNYFFGRIPQAASPTSGGIAHFDGAVLEEMIVKIQAKYKVAWPQATAAILQQVRGTAFDSSQIYADYVRIFGVVGCVVKPASDVFAGVGSDAEESGSSEPIRNRGGDPSDIGVVRMSTLGFNGRFANQIFQYAYLKLYANRQGLRAECPPWIGNSLFGHQTSLGESELPVFREDKGETDAMIRFDPAANRRDFELWGYFQDSRHWSSDRGAFRSLFQPLPFLKNPLDEAINRVRKPDGTLVAIHLRWGDFSGGETFWPAPEVWYLRWLSNIWSTLNDPVLYIATDDPNNVIPHFAAYQPKTSADLNVTLNGAEFYSDFYVLSKCDVLGISNSTFSFAAAMMNITARIFARPDPVREQMVDFDPWGSAVQLQKPGHPASAQAA